MEFIEQEHAIHVAGIELRTSNEEARSTIPAHWDRFSCGRVLEGLPGRLDQDVYAVYTHFENAGRDNRGIYSLVIGARIDPSAVLPAGMVRAVVPASRRAAFAVPDARPDLVGKAWQDIWQHTELPKTCIADYERYGADGSIRILVGVEREPAAR